MKLITAAAALALTALASQAPAQAHVATLEVSNAWSRPAAAGTNGVGYMVIANHGAADALVAVESPAAAKVEMHLMSMTGAVMSMARQDRVAAPGGGKIVFGAGGYHLMLLDLKRTLKVGDTVPATLDFASGAKVKVVFKVAVSEPAADMAGMSH